MDEDPSEPGEYEFRHIVVQSPGAALVMVQRFRPSVELSIEDYAKQLMDATIAEADSLVDLGPIKPLSAARKGSRPVRSMVAGAIRDGVESRFDMKALGESVPHRVRAFKIDAADATVFLVTQAAIDDWSKVAPGFDLIAETLSVE